MSDLITNQLLFKDMWEIYGKLILGNNTKESAKLETFTLDKSETVHKITSGMDGVPFKGISYDLVSDKLPHTWTIKINRTWLDINK